MKERADNLSAICLRWQDGVPDSLPLQTTAMKKETSHKNLLEDARIHNAGMKLRQQPAADPKDTARKTLENTIDELESFLARFEKKL